MKKILFICFAFIACTSLAQNTMELQDSTNLKKKNFDNQFDYENFLDPFPPKKQNNWSVGVGVGLPVILGDFRPYPLGSVGAHINVRKAFSHVFSLRFQSIFAQAKGYDYRKHLVNGVSAPLNYKARMTDNTLQAVFTLNNINFHKKQPKVAFNVFAGAGFMSSFVQHNLLDDNGNSYNYSGLANVETYSDRRFVVNQIINMQDKGFETNASIENGSAKIRDTRILPSFVFGSGLDFYLSKRLDLSLESRVSRHISDQLDGYNIGRNDDWFSYTSVALNFKLGKKVQPLYWENPLKEPYTDIMEIKQGQDPSTSFQDLDQDGVIDIFDQDLNTPQGVEVNSKGVALDNDKDGVPNYRDKEINSPDGAKVDAFGRSIDTDGDGVPDVLDLEAKTPANALVDVNGREIKSLSNASNQTVNNILYMRGVDIWTIFFEVDDYQVQSDYYPIVLNLASYMIEDPSAELVITGYTDNTSTPEYNLELSKKRANSVLALFTKMGVDANRFTIEYKGETDPLVDNGSNINKQLNRRVTLKVR